MVQSSGDNVKKYFRKKMIQTKVLESDRRSRSTNYYKILQDTQVDSEKPNLVGHTSGQ